MYTYCTNVHIHMHKYIHAYVHIHTHTHTHTRNQMHNRNHTCKQAHTVNYPQNSEHISWSQIETLVLIRTASTLTYDAICNMVRNLNITFRFPYYAIQ